MNIIFFTPSTSRRLDYIYAEGNIVAVRVYENGVGSLYSVYEKELFHRNRVLNGERLETFDLNGFEKYKFYPEEAKGFLYAGYNNGLYPTSKIAFFNQADFYWWNVYGVSIREPRFYDFIYKIPRRW